MKISFYVVKNDKSTHNVNIYFKILLLNVNKQKSFISTKKNLA